MTAGSAELLPKQRVENMVESAARNRKSRESPQKGSSTGLHSFYYRLVSRDIERFDCAVRREMNLKAWKTLDHEALN